MSKKILYYVNDKKGTSAEYFDIINNARFYEKPEIRKLALKLLRMIKKEIG